MVPSTAHTLGNLQEGRRRGRTGPGALLASDKHQLHQEVAFVDDKCGIILWRSN